MSWDATTCDVMWIVSAQLTEYTNWNEGLSLHPTRRRRSLIDALLWWWSFSAYEATIELEKIDSTNCMGFFAEHSVSDMNFSWISVDLNARFIPSMNGLLWPGGGGGCGSVLGATNPSRNNHRCSNLVWSIGNNTASDTQNSTFLWVEINSTRFPFIHIWLPYWRQSKMPSNLQLYSLYIFIYIYIDRYRLYFDRF